MKWSVVVSLWVGMSSAVPQFRFQDDPPAPGRPRLPLTEQNGAQPPPPPPPPSKGIAGRFPTNNRQKGSAGGSRDTSSKQEGQLLGDELPLGFQAPLPWIYDYNCADVRPPFGNGRWLQVDYLECPAAFVGDNFRDHGAFCRYGGDLAEAYDGERMWLYGGSRSFYCYNMPYLLCPILEKCTG